MGISPIASVRGISLLKPSKEENSRLSAVSFEPAGSMGDDAYHSGNDAQEQNLKEDHPDPDVESEAGGIADEEGGPATGEGDPRVNLFA